MATRPIAWYAAVLCTLVALAPHARAACGPGNYSPDNQVTCIPCPPGTWQDQSGASTCKDAQAGWFAAGPGATAQSPCLQGTFSTGLAAACTICPAGSHCNGNTNTAPQLCEPGRFSASPGAGQDCDLCPPGTFTAARGSTSCCPCCSGWYTDQSGQTHCFNCPNRGDFQQGWSPVGASSAGQCIAAAGALSSCSQSGSQCPPTGGSAPSGGAQKRSPPYKPRVKRCPKGLEACPVYGMLWGAGYTRTFECVDTQTDLESCGGCVDNDSPHGERNLHGGRDCSAIPNVDSVRCVSGKCLIERCRNGYAVTKDGQKCRPLFLGYLG